MAAQDCRSAKTHVQVRLTRRQVKSLFSAINTAGRLSAGRILRRDPLEDDLMDAIEKLERASVLCQGEADEWLLD